MMSQWKTRSHDRVEDLQPQWRTCRLVWLPLLDIEELTVSRLGRSVDYSSKERQRGETEETVRAKRARQPKGPR